jgi:hypothetical protein
MKAAGNPLLEAIEQAIAAEPIGDPVGNVRVARGKLAGQPVHAAFVENRVASGSIGTAEARKLGALFQIVARERSPLVVWLDSAGAKVSEGLAALGAFRRVYREGLRAAIAGAPMAALLGRNCYGGASMLAHLARLRIFGAGTQLAMSGPSILAATAGMNALDEAFRAMAEASISSASRARAHAANRVWTQGPLSDWLEGALASRRDTASEWRVRHAALQARLPKESPHAKWESVRRRDLERLYAKGLDAREDAGLLEGTGAGSEGEERIIGIVGKAPLGAERAWRFANIAWDLLEHPPPRVRVLLDCATHAARLDDERIVLSEYIVGMSAPLALLATRGTHVELTILGDAGGGVYVALAGPATHVSAVHGARIRVLPGSALAAILGEAPEDGASAREYQAAGVAEEELKLGLLPT